MANKKKKDKKKGKKAKKDKDLKAKSKATKASPKKATAKKGSAKKSVKASKDPMRALAQRIVAVSIANDDDAILALYADDVESTEMNQPPMTGREALRAKFDGWHNMVSDPKFTANNVWVDGDTIVIEWTGDVTLKENGRQAQLREIAVHEIKNGKITRERYYYDPSALQP